jgi:DHA2 family multidrug resistance protein
VGMINLLLVSRFIEDPPYLIRETGKVDFLGVGLLAVGLGSLQIMLEKGEQKNWFSSNLIVYLALMAAAGLLFFVLREMITDRPAVDLRILKDLTFTSGTFIGGVLGMGLFGTLFLLPLLLQELLGYPAFDSGLALMPRSLAMAVTMPIAGRVYNRAGPRVLVFLGLGISSLSFWELSRLSLNVGFWDIVFPQFIQGVGFGTIFVALSTVALSGIAKPKMQAATGLYNVVRLVFGSVGIAVAATELDRGTVRYGAILMRNVTEYRDTAQEWLRTLSQAIATRGSDGFTARLQALRLINTEVTRQAMMIAFNRLFYMVCLLFVFCLPLVYLLREPAKRKGQATSALGTPATEL